MRDNPYLCLKNIPEVKKTIIRFWMAALTVLGLISCNRGPGMALSCEQPGFLRPGETRVHDDAVPGAVPQQPRVLLETVAWKDFDVHIRQIYESSAYLESPFFFDNLH